MSSTPQCHIISAGDFHGISIPIQQDDYVIAVDGGYLYCKENNIIPNCLIGDFDSLIKSNIPNDIPVYSHPSEKDDTDTMLAVKEALSLGYRTIHMHACTGDRLDHTMANMQTLLYISKQNAKGYLYAKTECFTVVTNSTLKLPASDQGIFSVLSISDVSTGVCIKGGKYEAINTTLRSQIPLGVRNAFIGKEVHISLKTGSLLISWDY